MIFISTKKREKNVFFLSVGSFFTVLIDIFDRVECLPFNEIVYL